MENILICVARQKKASKKITADN